MAETRRSYTICGLAMWLAALLLTPGAARSEQWYLVSTGQNGDRFYVDADSIQPDGTDLKAWVRVDYKEPKSQGLFKSKVVQALDSNLLDCANKRTKLVSRHAQDTTGARIPQDLGTFALSYSDALPGSVSLAILGFACGRGRELAAKGAGSAVIPADIWRSDWRPVATRQDGAKIFVAANRIEQVPERRVGMVTFYELVVNQETQNFGSMPVRSEITLWMSSCQGRAMGSLGAAYYNEGQEVLFRSEPASVSALQPPPNTIGRFALDFVCGQPVALGSTPGARASTPATEGSGGTPGQANARP
ncbi:MAG TPA: surface-adhesin E family protein, partial [Burkholderiales bacterium]|nr:surface-adhesin E family protein [Burkholderiales bacterium]